jgi:hypothetical protein
VLSSPNSIERKGATTANNNRQQPPTTANNRQQQQPPTTANNRQQPPTTANKRQQQQQQQHTMTTSATEDQTRKRVLISDPAELSTLTRSSVTQDFALRSFASLPTPMKSLATHYTATLTSLQNKARQRSITIGKMAEDTFIPTSARIKFELGATQKVKETATFTTLAENTKTLVKKFQQALKANMVTVANLELKSIQSDINTTLREAIRDISTIIVMNHFPKAENYQRTAQNLVRATLDDHFYELAVYTTINDNSLFLLCKEITADHEPVYDTGNLLPGARLHIACLIAELFGTLKKIAVSSWKEQLDAILKKKKTTRTRRLRQKHAHRKSHRRHRHAP